MSYRSYYLSCIRCRRHRPNHSSFASNVYGGLTSRYGFSWQCRKRTGYTSIGNPSPPFAQTWDGGIHGRSYSRRWYSRYFSGRGNDLKLSEYVRFDSRNGC